MATTEEIIIKVKGDISELEKDLANLKGQMASIQNIEKNDLFAKANANAKDLKKSLELIAKASGNIKLDNFNVEEIVNDTQKLKKLIEILSQSLKGMKQGTTEFNSLEAIIKSANVQLQALNFSTEKTGDSIRTQMRTSVQEVQNLVDKFGLASKEAAEAAKRAGDLGDTVDDAKDLINAFKPGAGFGAVANALGGVASGFSAVQGAMGLISSESEYVEEMLLKVNSAMALSEGIQGVSQARDSFNILKVRAVEAFRAIKAGIGSTGIGLLVVALATIYAYWDDIKEAISGVTAEQRNLLIETQKDVELSKSKLDILNAQEASLKLQGFTEREIVLMKIKEYGRYAKLQKKELELKRSIEDTERQTAKDRENSLVRYLGIYGIALNQLLKGDLTKEAAEERKKQEELEAIQRKNQRALEDANILETEAELKLQLKEIDKKAYDEAGRKRKENLDKIKKDEKEYDDYLEGRLEEDAKRQIKGWEDEAKGEKELDDYLDKILDDAAKKQIEGWNEERKNAESVGTAIGDAYKRGYKTAEEYQQDLIDKQKQAVNDLLDFAQNGILLSIGLNPNDLQRVRLNLEELKKTLDDANATPEDKAAAAAQAAGAAYQTVSNSIFAADTQRRQEELAALQVQQEEELRLAGDNEQKKDLIRQKYALKEKEIKRKQAEADKKKAIMDATIKTAVAVITAISQSPLTFGMPWAAIVAALGAAEIAMIAATPIPKFAKGVVSFDGKGGLVKGEGTGTSDSNLAYLSKGESVIPAEPTRANLGLINELVNGDVDSYINRHYVMPALQAKEIQAANNYRHSVIEAENNLIARVSSSTLKSIDRRLVETNNSIKGLAKKDYSW